MRAATSDHYPGQSRQPGRHFLDARELARMLNESPTDIRDDATVVIYAVQKVLAQFARHHAGDRIGTNRGVINPGRIKLQFVADLIEMDRTLENALVDPGVCRGGIGRAPSSAAIAAIVCGG